MITSIDPVWWTHGHLIGQWFLNGLDFGPVQNKFSMSIDHKHFIVVLFIKEMQGEECKRINQLI